MGIYTWVENISRKSVFLFLALSVLILFFITKIRITINIIFALVIAAIVCYYFQDKYLTVTSDINTELEYKLNSLVPRPANFHTDADLIELFYNIREYRTYHPDAYDQALRNVDSILEIKREMIQGVDICKHYYDVAMEQYKSAMNNMQSIVFMLPGTKDTDEKFQSTLDELQIMLRRHVDDLAQICNQQNKENPIIQGNGRTPPSLRIENEAPFPNDPRNNMHYNVYA